MATFSWGSEIGSGGFGRVVEASFVDPDDPRNLGVALAGKFLKDELLHDEEAVRRFSGEVRILQQLSHPNIISVVGRNLSKTPPWFVMPFAESNLDVELHQCNRAGDRDWVIEMFAGILTGMAYAHTQGVIHRDLKPENVLFIQHSPTISDFGLGRRLDSSTTRLTMSQATMGTLAYMAPEQFGEVKECGAPADVYALGKILWEMLSGEVPQPMILPDLDAIPGDFRHFVSRCCATDPSSRYSDASETLAAFEVLTATSPQTAIDPPMQVAEHLVKEWANTPEGPDLDVLRELDAHLARFSDEEEFYFELIPRLPQNLLDQYIHALPVPFAEMLSHYDHHITGGLPFDYCDVVTNFYEYLFARVGLPLKRMILARLLDIGASHNRWHVGNVVARMLAAISDRGIDQLAAEVIQADQGDARWFLDYVKNEKLPTLVAAAFEQLKRS